LNDPMAIFLTILLVELLRAGAGQPIADMGETVLVRFALQFPASAVIGIAGGYGLLYIVNRLNIAAGLYPILAVSAALILFAGTQALGGSGFLVAYLAGFVFGSRRHRATQIIGRFHDGLAWLMQITMFLVLGLLVTPSAVLPMLAAAIGIAAVLMLVARPLAVLLCLLPFRYPPREVGFISWVGLRGAVPIYLGTIPVLSGIEESYKFFGVVYVVVIATLIVQGWTVAVAGRRLGMVLAPRPQVPARVDIDLPREVGRDMTAYTVHPTSLALRRPVARMPLPEQVDIVSVFRDGAIRAPGELTDLAPGDYVLLMAPTDRLPDLDRLFGAKWRQRKLEDPGIVDFEFPADTPTGAVADEYGFRVRAADRDLPLGAFLALCLREPPQAGQRLRRGVIELVAKEVLDGRIASVAIDLDPADWSWRRADPIRIFWRRFVWRPVARGSKTLLRRLAKHPAALARRISRRRAT
ncbi:MAG: potassium/proton antiporter, partial [Bauldia litoralis]